MQTLTEIKHLLASRGLAPRKSLGQNFLVDHNLIRKLADAANLSPRGLVLEVGPGTGALTGELLARSARVIACELDEGLAALIHDRFGTLPDFTLIRGDCLSLDRSVAEGAPLRRSPSLNPALITALASRPFTLVANLPYGAATPLLITLLTDHPECGAMFVTIQRELADRLTSEPRRKEYGPLSILAQALARVDRLAVLPPECFWPRPEVTSAMVSIARRPDPMTRDPKKLLEITQRLFAQRRKQIGKTLESLRLGPSDLPPGVDPRMRAEELSVEQAVALADRAAQR